MSSHPFTLSTTEWLFLRVLELGDLDLSRADEVMAKLEILGLVEQQGIAWKATDYDRLLAASRRSIAQ